MSKNFLYKAIAALVLVFAAVLYILSVAVPDTFGFFNLSWAGMVLCTGWGAILLIQGIFKKNVPLIKKFKIVGGSALLIVAVVCAVTAVLLPKELVMPIVAIILAVAVMLGVLATGGKGWDEGDNQKAGYQNYFERKKEEEKQQKNEDK